MREYGLIGHPLSHSFSKSYFESKFQREGLKDHAYHLFDLEDLASEFSQTIKGHQYLVGLNVTIPYKEKVISYMDEMDQSAEKVGAVNVINIINGKLIGFNSDYYGFKTSLSSWFGSNPLPEKALVLGTGGASKAVYAALEDLGIASQGVSRTPSGVNQLSYDELSDPEIIGDHHLIVNTTPLGMFPNTVTCPDIPYSELTNEHWLYDLVYNPEMTRFMELGSEHGARTLNGLEMLHLQAEKSWEIWNA